MSNTNEPKPFTRREYIICALLILAGSIMLVGYLKFLPL